MNIDWSKAPEGFPVWLEDVRPLMEGADRSCWAREGKGEYELHSGGWWSYSARGTQYITHYRAEWSGEGLPPVGTVCEFAGFNPEETLPTDPRVGDQVTVIAHFMSGSFEVAAFTFYAPPEFEYLQVAQGAHGCFRPIRTPEQIAAEERQAKVDEMMEIIYQARKILPLTPASPQAEARVAAEALYDANFRKQVAP